MTAQSLQSLVISVCIGILFVAYGLFLLRNQGKGVSRRCGYAMTVSGTMQKSSREKSPDFSAPLMNTGYIDSIPDFLIATFGNALNSTGKPSLNSLRKVIPLRKLHPS